MGVNVLKKWLSGLMVVLSLLYINGTCLALPAPPQEYDSAIKLTVDANFLNLASPVIIHQGRVMVSLQDLPAIFTCEAWAQPGEIRVTGYYTFITMFPGRSDYLVNSAIKEADTAPLIMDTDRVYVPLRVVAEEFRYAIGYDAPTRQLVLQSPEYQQSHPGETVPPPVVLPPIEFNPQGNWGLIPAVNPLVSAQETFITGYFTRLLKSPAGRTTNITLSCGKINGKVLQPGEIFSFNQTVGPRTANAGYQSAAIFAGRKVVSGIGGGICQTATTLYNLALEANLQVVERHPHSLKVAYTAAGRDATVSWGSADLRFINTMDYPVKILCRVENDLVIVALVRE
jgi:hypothetical protein